MHLPTGLPSLDGAQAVLVLFGEFIGQFPKSHFVVPGLPDGIGRIHPCPDIFLGDLPFQLRTAARASAVATTSLRVALKVGYRSCFHQPVFLCLFVADGCWIRC